MLNILIGGVPLIVIAYFIHFRKNYNSNNILVIMIFMSYMIFATNYENYGLNFDLFRYVHKFIGIILALSLIYYVLKSGFKILQNPVTLLLFLFLGVVFLSYINNDVYLSNYIHYTRNFIFISIIILYIFFKIRTNGQLDELFHFIVNITLILSFFVIIEIIIRGNITRVFLFYPNPNYLSLSLLFGFSILLFLDTKYKFFKIALVLLAIYFTESRAVEVAVLLLFLIYIFKNRTLINFKYYILGFISLIIIGNMYFDKLPMKQDIRSVRIGLAQVSIKAFKENVINGIGYGQFRTNFYKYVDDDIIALNYPLINTRAVTKEEVMTHSDLWQIVAELGLLGIGFLIFYFYKLYFELKKLIVINKDYYYISISLIIGSLTFSLVHNNITSFVFWFILFLPFIMTKIHKNSEI